MSHRPFANALSDVHRDNQTEPLYACDGSNRMEHPVEEFYFTPFPARDDTYASWLESQLSGPLLDIGAGVGKHALYFQKRFETTAIEVDELLVDVMRERGVTDARIGDLFELETQFDSESFHSVLCYGTQMGLVKSMAGLKKRLAAIADITTQNGTFVFDGYDPTHEATSDLLGHRRDSTPGLGFRVFSFEYGGIQGKSLLFRLFSPERVREACQETVWQVTDLWRPDDSTTSHYLIALEKDGQE